MQANNSSDQSPQLELNISTAWSSDRHEYADLGASDKPWPSWRQPSYGVVVLVVAYMTVAVLGVLNNALVIAAVFYHTSMRTVTNYFLANLAVADILVCVFVLPATLLQNIYTGNIIVIIDEQ